MQSNDFFSFDYEEVKTDSGLKILFIRDESLPYVRLGAYFLHAGADYDFEGKSGLAGFTALLSDQGAGGLSSSQLQEEINQLGTSLEVFVGRQRASFFLSGLSWHGEALWEFFQKILSEPHFEEKEVGILRGQALSRRRRQLDQTDFVADFVWRRELFSGPVGASDDGTLISLSKISLEDIKQFHKSRYLNGNPLFVLVGKYDNSLKKKIISFVEERFSYQKKSEDFSLTELEPKFQLLTNDQLVQSQIRLGYPIGPFPVEEPNKFLVLQIANSILGGASNSRLHMELREKRGLTYSVRSGISFGKFYGFFTVEGSSRTETTPEFLQEALKVLKRFREEGISLDELKGAREILIRRHLSKIERPEGQLSLWVHYAHHLALDPRFLKNYTSTLNNISLEEVNQLIKEFVLSGPLHVVVYGHSSLKVPLEGLADDSLPALQSWSFEDYFKKELNFNKN